MCGIAGFVDQAGFSDGDSILRRMADTIEHRGPDSEGYWTDENLGIGLAHRRLSILDLSPAGHQPMLSQCGRFVVSYNGEIYNHLDIRSDLEAICSIDWRGHSDTETLVQGFSRWGIRETLERSNGMFALAVWDRKLQTLTLARDRMGEKPLYYGFQNGKFLFGSELKALQQHPSWEGKIDRDVLTLFLRHNYVPGPYSIYSNIKKLPPAHYVEIQAKNLYLPEPIAYWNLESQAIGEHHKPFDGSAEDALNHLEYLVTDAVGIRMAADVPLGAFLSGGVDSSVIVALMQKLSSNPVKTFSIGFEEAEYDEAPHAREIAKFLGTDHTEMYVSSQDALDQISKLPRYWDEPFADSSQIPTMLVSNLAHSQVSVSLSGDGGDELFCGYTRYTQGYEFWRKLGLLPRFCRAAISNLIRRLPANTVGKMLQVAPEKWQKLGSNDRLLKLADVMDVSDHNEFYRSLVSHSKRPEELVLHSREPSTLLSSTDTSWNSNSDFRERMMYLDMKTYLPDDILVKVDRASMATSLETRVPLLDHRIVEFALDLPMALKVRNGQTKWLLRQLLYRHVPRSLIERPKMGFGVPIEHWLQGPLKNWADDLLSESKLRREGFFDVEKVQNMWSETRIGKRRWHYHIWDVLMFQAWLDGIRKQ